MSLLEQYGARPRKALGQNFVIDPNTIRKVLAAAELQPSSRVLEIGAGAGSLTLGLASTCEHVLALEKDERLLPILDEVLQGYPVEVVHGDVMQIDLAGLDVDRCVANLPYNIAASAVLKVLESAPRIERLTVMTQKEVGERLAASPGTKIYGLTSVLVGFQAGCRVVTHVSRNAFYPVPDVDSVVVDIERKKSLSVEHHRLYVVAKSAFGHRRKTLRSNLSNIFGSPEAVTRELRELGIDAGRRAEELDIDDFVRIAQVTAK